MQVTKRTLEVVPKYFAFSSSYILLPELCIMYANLTMTFPLKTMSINDNLLMSPNK